MTEEIRSGSLSFPILSENMVSESLLIKRSLNKIWSLSMKRVIGPLDWWSNARSRHFLCTRKLVVSLVKLWWRPGLLTNTCFYFIFLWNSLHVLFWGIIRERKSFRIYFQAICEMSFVFKFWKERKFTS